MTLHLAPAAEPSRHTAAVPDASRPAAAGRDPSREVLGDASAQGTGHVPCALWEATP